MVIVGLTGGIGSGKSTVAGMFQDEGAYVIDFDILARIVVEPGKPAWEKIAQYFGPNVLSSDGSINRPALGRVVFAEEKGRKALEGFVHPMILKERDKLIEEIRDENPSSIVIIDFPLLFELGMNEDFDKIVLAYVPRDVQIKRVMKRDGLSMEDVKKRLNAQMPIDEKRNLSDYIINAERAFGDMRGQMKKVMSELNKIAERGRAN
jgi:dephospho-CoA kinase